MGLKSLGSISELDGRDLGFAVGVRFISFWSLSPQSEEELSGLDFIFAGVIDRFNVLVGILLDVSSSVLSFFSNSFVLSATETGREGLALDVGFLR